MTEAAPTETIPPLREQPPQLEGERRPKRRLRRFGTWLVSPDSTALVYLGLILAAGGFGLIALTWGQIASTLSVPLQIPYLASGGLIGIGLVILGVAITSIGVKRRDNFARIRQLQKLSATMESIEGALTGSDRERGAH